MRAFLYQSVAVAGWTPQSGSVTPAAHPLSTHFPSAQVIKKHLCFSIRLHIWGRASLTSLGGGTQVPSRAQLWCGPGSPFSVSIGGQKQIWKKSQLHGICFKMAEAPPPRTLQRRAPGGALVPALMPMPAFAQANSLYPHENQWMEQIVLNYVK